MIKFLRPAAFLLSVCLLMTLCPGVRAESDDALYSQDVSQISGCDADKYHARYYVQDGKVVRVAEKHDWKMDCQYISAYDGTKYEDVHCLKCGKVFKHRLHEHEYNSVGVGYLKVSRPNGIWLSECTDRPDWPAWYGTNCNPHEQGSGYYEVFVCRCNYAYAVKHTHTIQWYYIAYGMNGRMRYEVWSVCTKCKYRTDHEYTEYLPDGAIEYTAAAAAALDAQEPDPVYVVNTNTQYEGHFMATEYCHVNAWSEYQDCSHDFTGLKYWGGDDYGNYTYELVCGKCGAVYFAHEDKIYSIDSGKSLTTIVEEFYNDEEG